MRYENDIKKDAKAAWIWLRKEASSKNVWLCFNKSVTIDKKPERLIANIAAENKYQLFINGETVLLEGGLKRGPSPTGCYYDEIDIAPYLTDGENLISIAVWYWGNEASYSSADAGCGGLFFEAENDDISILSDSTWKVIKNPAFRNDRGKLQPNYRIPESNIYYDARKELDGWNKKGFDFSGWKKAKEYDVGGAGVWGEMHKRAIPLFKDYGLKDYENSSDFENRTFGKTEKITLKIPYNAQCTPYLKVDAPAGKKIVITTENTKIGAIHSTYVTKKGVQEFESPAWFNGERITYEIPSKVRIISLKYRESGYNTEFCGSFICENGDMNSLWQKSLRTLYVTMRDNFMDCPDRERAQWWGDATNEMMMSMYCLDEASYLLYRKGVKSMILHINPETKVLQTVVPIKNDFFELPMQQLAGICGFLTYYNYTGDRDFIEEVYSVSADYLNLWKVGKNGLVEHKKGSWDWFDWGEKIDEITLENAWYYYAVSAVRSMAQIVGDKDKADELTEKMKSLYNAYQTLWSGEGYKSEGNTGADDRGNAVAVLSGLCPPENYGKMKNLLYSVRNSSPYMEYYVLEALCRMGEYELSQKRMCERYKEMTEEDYSTLWELFDKNGGTMNHAWSGGPLVIMSGHIAGVRPLEAGYGKISVMPRYELYKSLSCKVPTVKGEISLEYGETDGRMNITVNCPETAETKLRITEGAVVIFNGEKIFDKEILSDGVSISDDKEILTIR